ncbi:COP9 signalosome complex subunit 3 [Colletotrichum tropicale]|nr:COP9 signalosome complex subunit 3 [Colletotrichum tropicale]
MDATLLSFEPDQGMSDEVYDSALKNHIAQISRLFKDLGNEVVANAPQLLEIVNPATHSVAFLAILNTLKRLDDTGRSISADAFREYTLKFLLSFDPRQIRYVGDAFSDLVKDVVDCKFYPARQAIEIVAIVLRRLDPDCAVLTSHHVAVVKMAYETDNIDQVLPLVEKPWVFLPGMKDQSQPAYLCDVTASPASYINTSTHLSQKLTREEVMQHEWVTAQIFTAKLRWADAHKAYQRIISWPTRDGATSKIMTDAHKRWILTGLLTLGQTPTPPSFIAPAATKNYASLSKLYTDIGSLFPTVNAEELKSAVEAGTPTWVDDQTTTLLKEVVKAYQKWQILGLADVYQKIGVSEIREKTLSAETAKSLETDVETEALLQDMISSGMLVGALETSPDGAKCLRFLPRDQEIEHTEYKRKITDDARIETLNKWAKASDARLMFSKDYARHIDREAKRSQKDSSSQHVEMFETSIEDEDLMTGIQPTR